MIIDGEVGCRDLAGDGHDARRQTVEEPRRRRDPRARREDRGAAREQRRAAGARALAALRRTHDVASGSCSVARSRRRRCPGCRGSRRNSATASCGSPRTTSSRAGSPARRRRWRATETDSDRARRRLRDGPPPGAAGDGDRDARPHVPGPPAPGHRPGRAGLDAPDGRQAEVAADRAARVASRPCGGCSTARRSRLEGRCFQLDRVRAHASTGHARAASTWACSGRR